MIMYPHDLPLQKGRATQGSRERVKKVICPRLLRCGTTVWVCRTSSVAQPFNWDIRSSSCSCFPVVSLIQLTVSPWMLSEHHCLSVTSVPRQFVFARASCNSPQSQCHLQRIGLLHVMCSPSDRPLQMAFWFWVLPRKVLPQQLNLFTCYNTFYDTKWISFMDWEGCSNKVWVSLKA